MKKILLLALLIPALGYATGRITNSDLTGSAGITNANLATMPTLTLKGNNTGGASTPIDLTAAQAKTLLSISAADLTNGVTGSGALVLATSPTLVTPTLGAALATSINGMSLSCGGGSCSFSMAPSKSFAVNNSISLSGTDGASLNIGAGGTLVASAFTDTTDASNITSGTLPIARIADGAVTNAKLADMAQATIKGRASGAGTGAPQDLTGTQATAILDTFTTTLKGLVPPPGTVNGYCLKDDGTWGTAGTVSPLTTKGDLYTYSTLNTRLPVGANDQLLVPDSAQTTGLKWTTTLPTAAVPAFTGDVTNTAGSLATTIANSAVTNAKMADMATQTFKGRTTAGTGAPEDLTATQATAMLNNFVGDSGGGGVKGLVPAPAAADAAAGKVLKADGTWGAAGTTSPLTTKGDLYTYTTTNARLPVGTNYQTLFADSTQSTGLAWADPQTTLKRISQTTHGFSVGQAVYYTGSTYALAKADSDSTSEVLGLVYAVPDANTFVLAQVGYITGLSGLTAGSAYYLSDTTAGALTATHPTTPGHVSKPVLVADSTTSGYIIQSRGIDIAGQSLGATAYAGYFGATNTNYWATNSTSVADFTLTGAAIPLNQQYNNGFGTVSAAASSILGVTFTPAFSCPMRVTVVGSYLYAGGVSNANMDLYVTDGSNNVLSQQSSFYLSGPSQREITVPPGYLSVTAGNTYTVKLRGKTSSGSDTLYVGGEVGMTNAVNFNLECVK